MLGTVCISCISCIFLFFLFFVFSMNIWISLYAVMLLLLLVLVVKTNSVCISCIFLLFCIFNEYTNKFVRSDGTASGAGGQNQCWETEMNSFISWNLEKKCVLHDGFIWKLTLWYIHNIFIQKPAIHLPTNHQTTCVRAHAFNFMNWSQIWAQYTPRTLLFEFWLNKVGSGK